MNVRRSAVRRLTAGAALLVAIALCVTTTAEAQTSAQVQPPRVSSSVDRTAMWIGDRVVFRVEIVCAPGVDILLDDLAADKLKVNGLQILSSDAVVVNDASGGSTHQLRYVVTSYAIDNPSPSIEAISVRYYARRPGERLQDVAPAGDVRIPGAVIAFRSTLAESQVDLAIRDGRTPPPRRAMFARASQLGLALVVLALAPAVVLAAAAIRQRTAGKPVRRTARQTRQEQRAVLERIRSMDVSSPEDRRRACDEIGTAVRGYVASHTHVPATALTPAEIDALLAARGGRIRREDVVALLTTCDEARYRPAQAPMSAEACRDAIASAEQILAGR